MNQQVETMVAGFKTSVENILSMVADESKVADLKSAYDELMALVESHGDDFMAFVNRANGTNLFTRLSEELQKANDTVQAQQSDPSAAKEMGIDEVVNAYRAPYEQVKANPHMKETVAVYEEIFALAESSPDVGSFQVDIYKKKLPLKISMMTLYDDTLNARRMDDPNNTLKHKLYENKIAAAENSLSGNDLMFRDMQATLNFSEESAADEHIFYLVKKLFVMLLQYHDVKAMIRREFEKMRPDNIFDLVHISNDIKALYSHLQEYFGIDFDAIANNEWYTKKLFSVAMPLEKGDRIWLSQDPGNMQFFKNLLLNEILAEKSPADILRSQDTHVYNPPGKEDIYRQEGLDEKLLEWVTEKSGENDWPMPSESFIKDSLNKSFALNSQMETGDVKEKKKDKDLLFNALLEVDSALKYYL